MLSDTADVSQEGSRLRLLLSFSLITLALLLGSLNGMGRADQVIYDRTISLIQRPALDDILIIAIDDDAINALGRWPWPRSLHAMLLERLQEARAVGMDIVFSESDIRRTNDDHQLVQAVQRHGRVVLPIVLDNLHRPSHAALPLAPLAQAAAGLGYINVDADEDGVLRRTTWTLNGTNLPWHQFALAMLQVGDSDYQAEHFLQALPPDATSLIPYAGPPGHFHTVSYLSVLRGEVPREAIKDKYVLIGAWATGLGDVFPSPVSHHVSGISGVEVIANLLQAARQHSILTSAAAWQTALASALPVLLLCLALPRLSPRQAILCSVALLGVVLMGAALILYWHDLWIPPAAALLGIAVSYPIWSWRSQEAALRYMNREMKRLRKEYPPVLDEASQPARQRIGRSLDHHVDELDRTLTHVRNLRRFVEDGLDGMPDATMVLDNEGRLQYRNRPAATYFHRLGIRAPRIGRVVAPALEQAFPDPAARQLVHQTLQPHDAETAATHDTQHDATSQISIEVQDRAGHDLLIRCAPIRNARGAHAGRVVTLSDISAIRQAERQREETLRFISHDMRAPQNSILALVELNNACTADEDRPPPAQTLSRIAHLATRTLRLVDDFIQLTRAESMQIGHDRLDLVSLLYEITDDFWAATQARAITLELQSSVPVALVYGDATLLMRALVNLVDNAIKYSPDDSAVELRLSLDPGGEAWNIDIQDAGPGIAAEDQARLFKPFFRTGAARNSDTKGSGLGLAFVYTVAQRHGGAVTLDSTLGAGSRFTFSLPVAPDEEACQQH